MERSWSQRLEIVLVKSEGEGDVGCVVSERGVAGPGREEMTPYRWFLEDGDGGGMEELDACSRVVHDNSGVASTGVAFTDRCLYRQ